MDTYGFERVYNEGLTVKTTCDMALQQTAQAAAIDGVHSVDQRMGFRRTGVTQLESDEAINQARLQHEEDNKKSWARQQDAAGRIAPPETSILQAQHLYKAIVLEVQPRFARVAIGVHEGIIPIDWSHWVFTPNPRRSWRYRS